MTWQKPLMLQILKNKQKKQLCSSALLHLQKEQSDKRMILNKFLIGNLGIEKRPGAHLQHSQLELQKGGQGRFLGGWRAAELIEILTRLYRNAGWKKGSHTQSTTGQGYTGRRAAWLPAIWKEDKSNNKSKRKKRGNKGRRDKRRLGRTQSLWCSAFPPGLD